MPLLEELGYIPSEKYASGYEILNHCQRIAKAYGVYEKGCFGTKVTELLWKEDIKKWSVKTDKNDSMLCRYVCSCLCVCLMVCFICVAVAVAV